MKVGSIEVLPVIDGVLRSKFPATKPIPGPDSYVWQEQHNAMRPDGMLESSLGAFLVRTGDRVVLVDAGGGQALIGGYKPPVMNPDDESDRLAGFLRSRGMPDERVRQFAVDMSTFYLEQGQLPVSLAAVGLKPEDVTDVVFTHLHFDHTGWVSVEGSAYFPNATVYVADADLQYFLPGTTEDWFTSQMYYSQLVPDRLGPVLNRIETWEADSSILPGIDVRMAPGHTPGSSVVVISSGNERVMVLGDMVHCPLELMDDDFNLIGDHDQQVANQLREAYAREIEGTDVRVAASHFPGLQFGRLLPGEGVRHWTFDSE
jgi:glyoxylase-like metal-dependent hydrolase (beta-lactamase superfamily II)